MKNTVLKTLLFCAGVSLAILSYGTEASARTEHVRVNKTLASSGANIAVRPLLNGLHPGDYVEDVFVDAYTTTSAIGRMSLLADGLVLATATVDSSRSRYTFSVQRQNGVDYKRLILQLESSGVSVVVSRIGVNIDDAQSGDGGNYNPPPYNPPTPPYNPPPPPYNPPSPIYDPTCSVYTSSPLVDVGERAYIEFSGRDARQFEFNCDYGGWNTYGINESPVWIRFNSEGAKVCRARAVGLNGNRRECSGSPFTIRVQPERIDPQCEINVSTVVPKSYETITYTSHSNRGVRRLEFNCGQGWENFGPLNGTKVGGPYPVGTYTCYARAIGNYGQVANCVGSPTTFYVQP